MTKQAVRRRTGIDKIQDAIGRQLAHVAGAEVGHLIHVHPEPIKGHQSMEIADVIQPPRLPLGVYKIGEMHRPGPDLRECGNQ